MQVLALVTIYPGPVRPGETLELSDAEAKALMARGLAAPVPKPEAAEASRGGKSAHGRKTAQTPAQTPAPAFDR